MIRTRPAFLIAGALFASQAWAQAAGPAQQAQVRPAEDAAAATFKAWDKDGDGSLSLVEFRAGWQEFQRRTQVQGRLRQQFNAVDADRNGAIDPGEYGNLILVRNAGKNAPQMSVFDANRDGKLDFAEYVKLVQALAPTPAAPGKDRKK